VETIQNSNRKIVGRGKIRYP